MFIDTEVALGDIRLRHLSSKDATERYVSWLKDPAVNRFLESRFADVSVRSVVDFIERCNASSDELLLGVFVEPSLHVGNIKLGPIRHVHLSGPVGLMIGEKAYWGRGLATSAIRAMSLISFEMLGLEKVWAGCYENNVASLRAFVKSHFQIEGRQMGQWNCCGERVDGILLGLTRARWLQCASEGVGGVHAHARV